MFKVDGVGERLLFARTKSEKKIIREPACQTCSCFMSHVLKKQYPGKFRWLITSPDVLTGDVGLRSACSYTPMKVWRNVEKWTPYKSLTRVHKRFALLFDTWHSLLIFFELSLTKSPWSDWSTRYCLTNLIGWLFSDALLGFSGQPKSSVLPDVECPNLLSWKKFCRMCYAPTYIICPFEQTKFTLWPHKWLFLKIEISF